MVEKQRILPDDQDEINLVDKINLHFKSGAFTPIDFAPEHEYLVDLVGDAETFEDAHKGNNLNFK